MYVCACVGVHVLVYVCWCARVRTHLCVCISLCWMCSLCADEPGFGSSRDQWPGGLRVPAGLDHQQLCQGQHSFWTALRGAEVTGGLCCNLLWKDRTLGQCIQRFFCCCSVLHILWKFSWNWFCSSEMDIPLENSLRCLSVLSMIRWHDIFEWNMDDYACFFVFFLQIQGCSKSLLFGGRFQNFDNWRWNGGEKSYRSLACC